jgi:uncharacterized protein (DUF4415 family)
MAKKSGNTGKMNSNKISKNDQRTSGVWRMAREGGEEKLNITIRINKDVAEDFRSLCKKNGVSISDVVEAFFKKELSLK